MNNNTLPDPQEIKIEREADQVSLVFKHVFFAVLRTILDANKSSLSGGTFPEWDKALQVKTPIAMAANRLICKSIFAAVEHQIKDQSKEYLALRLSNEREFQLEVYSVFADSQYIFRADDINTPENLGFLPDFKGYYQDWLVAAFDVTEARAAAIAAYFTDYFAYYFYEYRQDYPELWAWANSEDKQEQALLKRRMRYRADLVSKYHLAALGEKEVALSDVYIEPYFKVFAEMLEDDFRKELYEEQGINSTEHFLPVADYSIHEFFLSYFIKNKLPTAVQWEMSASRMLILLGQPGHGKSSFCYRSIRDLLDFNQFHGETFFVPLKKAGKEILDNPLREIATILDDSGDGIDFKNWKFGKRKRVFFLDGLDEFFMTQSLSDAEVLRFINNCKRVLERQKSLYFVITSRFNYVETRKLFSNDCYLFSLGELTTEQQQSLITKYQTATNKTKCNIDAALLRKINKADNHSHVKELIELPILLQMILISGIDVSDVSSRGAIYNELFSTVINRKWTTDGRLKKYIHKKKFKQVHLREYLSLLALKIFQSRNNYLHKNEIKNFPETKNFKRRYLKVETPSDSLQDVLKDILTSFYLKETEKTGAYNEQDKDHQYSIEFLHKSLYEYLACEYLWEATKALFLKKDTDDYYIHDDLNAIQTKVQELYALTRLTNETVGYLKEIIANDLEDEEGNNIHEDLSKRMSEYLPKLLQHGFIAQYPDPKLPRVQATRYAVDQQSLHSFHIYVLIWGELKKHLINFTIFKESQVWGSFHAKYCPPEVLEKVISSEKQRVQELITVVQGHYKADKKIEQLQSEWNIYKDWLKGKKEYYTPYLEQQLKRAIWRLQGEQFITKKAVFAKEESKTHFIRYLRLLGAEGLSLRLHLAFLPFDKADLQSSLLINIQLLGADLRYAHLHNADLRYAHLHNADLRYAHLRNADLRNADLRYADLRYADLSDADLSDTDLRYADLSDADLRYADLRYADLRYARVDTSNWLINLPQLTVKGYETIMKKYKVSNQQQILMNRHGFKHKVYRILPKDAEED